MDHTTQPQKNFSQLLDELADRIVEHGTPSESAALTTLADAAHAQSPGAAQALVDWAGSEIARLRAFSVVTRVLLRDRSVTERGSAMAALAALARSTDAALAA